MFERTRWLFGGKSAQILAILSLCIAIGAVELSEEQHEKLSDFDDPTSRFLTSSLSSGVPVPHTTQCIRGV